MGTELFIHHNLIKYRTLALFMQLPYHDTTTLHDNLAISYLRPLMPCYDNRGGKHPYLQNLMAHMVLPHVFIFYTLLYKISNFRIFLILYLIIQISTFQSISYFTMKHGNHSSYILSNLLEASHNYAFLIQHNA